jgi:hypothetical protein
MLWLLILPSVNMTASVAERVPRGTRMYIVPGFRDATSVEKQQTAFSFESSYSSPYNRKCTISQKKRASLGTSQHTVLASSLCQGRSEIAARLN